MVKVASSTDAERPSLHESCTDCSALAEIGRSEDPSEDYEKAARTAGIALGGDTQRVDSDCSAAAHGPYSSGGQLCR
jgi:hypothetical protein